MNVLTQALGFIKRQKRDRWRLQAMIGIAVVVIFITLYIFMQSVWAMENEKFNVLTTSSKAPLGETIHSMIYAEANDHQEETFFLLNVIGENAGLDESSICFNDSNVMIINDNNGNIVELHREYTQGGAAYYWFVLNQGESRDFILSWVNGVDSYEEEVIEKTVINNEKANFSTENKTEYESKFTDDSDVFDDNESSTNNDIIEFNSISDYKNDELTDIMMQSSFDDHPEEERICTLESPADSVQMDYTSAQSEENSIRQYERILLKKGDVNSTGNLQISIGIGVSKEEALSKQNNIIELFWNAEELSDKESALSETNLLFRSAIHHDVSEMFETSGEEYYDFKENITNVSVLKLENGQWIPRDEFNEGDSVRIIINYTLPKGVLGNKSKTIFYTLPEGVSLSQQEEGVVYDGVVPAGAYTITTDGVITIVFNDEFSDDSSFTGTIQFQGLLYGNSQGVDSEIKFGDSGSVIVKPYKLPTDVSVEKIGEYHRDENKVYYTVSVFTSQGTNGDITLTDRLHGNILAKYDSESFKIFKLNADKKEQIYEFSLDIKVSDWDSSRWMFSIKNLPALKAGESYQLDYSVTPSSSQHQNNDLSISNNVEVQTDGGDKANNYNNVVVKHKMIQKWGVYNQESGIIKWTILINPDKYDISGWILKDKIVVPEGITVQMPANVLLIGEGGNSRNITLPYQFPQGCNSSYSITYQTKVNGLKPGKSENIQNKAEFNDYAETASVTAYTQDYSLNKSWSWHDTHKSTDALGIEQWNVQIRIPESAELEKITYTDTLLVKNVDDEIIEETHYITLQQMKEMVVSCQDQILSFGTDYIFYDEQNSEINTIDSDMKYMIFHIKFLTEALDKVKGKTVNIRYNTTVDYTKLSSDVTYNILNTGWISNHQSEAQTVYEKPKCIEKQASATGQKGSYTKKNLTVDFDESKGIIHYRLLIKTDPTTKGDIVVTDILPSGSAFLKDTVRIAFYGNDYYEYPTSYFYGGSYTAQNHLNTSVEPGEENETTRVVFTIGDGYNGDGKSNTLALYYDVSIAEDSRWKDNPGLEHYIYKNKATWKCNVEMNVAVEREVKNVDKRGQQLPQYNTHGEQVYDAKGDPILSNIVRYSVIINQGKKNLDPVSDVVELKDTLFLPNSAVGADLNIASVRLYLYDDNKENYCGEEVNSARYSYIYDRNTHTLSVTVPDNTALVLVYDYFIDRGTSAGDLQLINTAELTGITRSSDEDQLQFHETSSSFTVTKRTLTVYKVDSSNYGKSLPGAQFQLEDWKNNTWENVNMFETDSNGQIVLNTLNSEGEAIYQTNTLYKLTETQAPVGYARDKTAYYFVWIGENQTIENCKSQMKSILSDVGISLNDVLFISNSSAIYVPNISTTLTIHKVWVDEDGRQLLTPGTNSVEVKLLQQQTVRNSVVVTVNWSGGQWGSSGTKKIEIAKGSALTISTGYWGNAYFYSIEDADRQPGQGNDIVLGSLLTDTRITIEGTYNANISFSNYEEPYFMLSGEQKLYTTVQLSKDTGWMHTWLDLPSADGKGNPVYYSVEETAVSGFNTIYSPNNKNGIQTGDLIITNQSNGYILPEAGGHGIVGFTIYGSALLLFASFVYMILRRREEKNQ